MHSPKGALHARGEGDSCRLWVCGARALFLHLLPVFDGPGRSA